MNKLITAGLLVFMICSVIFFYWVTLHSVEHPVKHDAVYVEFDSVDVCLGIKAGVQMSYLLMAGAIDTLSYETGWLIYEEIKKNLEEQEKTRGKLE